MSIFENFEKKLQAEPKSIVFTEGTDARILSAASRLLAGKTLKVILLGEVEAVKKAAADGSFDITGAEIIDPANYEGFDEMVAKMVELRKGKMTDEQCRAALSKGNYFGTMLVKQGKADCLLGGATYSTADTVRPALQLIKCKPGIKSVSSCFILTRGEESIAMGDCAINIDPSEDESSSPPSRPLTPQRFSASTPVLHCCPTPPRVPARARPSTRCATLPPAFRRLTPN